MHAEPEVRLQAGAIAPALSPLQAFTFFGACVAAVLVAFWPTVWSMVEIWHRTETYQHCFLVIPIALFLVWGERNALARTETRPFFPGFAVIVGLGAVWLVGQLAIAAVVTHFAVIAMVPAVVLTVFGRTWVRKLWFPLLFLFFAVPFGDVFVPKLMEWTADITVAALRVTGIPVYQEGMHLVIPSGRWSVIEACSGLKFLIASAMAGTLYAWLIYRSPGRRFAFVAASIVVPLLANWLRAYAIVMTGHLTNNTLMTGPDHIAFGWVLFGGVMMLMFWIGTLWRQDLYEAADGSRLAHDEGAAGLRGVSSGVSVAAGVLVFLLVWQPLAFWLERPLGETRPPRIAPVPEAAGWQPVAHALSPWVPDLVEPSSTGRQAFRKGEHVVGVFIGAFHHQSRKAMLATSVNQIANSENPRWTIVSRGTAGVSAEGVAERVRTAVVLDTASGGSRLLVWQWYWANNQATSSDLQGKLALARARLFRHPDTGVWVAIYTPAGESRAQAEQTLRTFLADMGPSLRGVLSETSAQ